jgi:hypothetical protein
MIEKRAIRQSEKFSEQLKKPFVDLTDFDGRSRVKITWNPDLESADRKAGIVSLYINDKRVCKLAVEELLRALRVV